ncbi:MAG: hypothetical protein HGA94_05230, partial [Candidatus Aminicenantes bacterium]|nr:hypothetical protein [Candidatus Aminicenantes bacterium]
MKRSLSSLLACGGFVFVATILTAQDNRVAPENANEARLNRLQPHGQVMDSICAAAGMTIAEIGAGQGRY